MVVRELSSISKWGKKKITICQRQGRSITKLNKEKTWLSLKKGGL